MKVLVSGSRSITDYEHVRQAFILSGIWKAHKRNIEVVCGMAVSWKWKDDPAAGGVDHLAYDFALRNGLKVHEFHADWKKYGKGAGYIRNADMGKFTKRHNGMILAVWDGKSSGTRQMIDWARDNSLPGFIYRADKPARYAPVGTEVWTDFSGKRTNHVVVEKTRAQCQSGVACKVEPPVPKSNGDWIDADWFELI